MLSALKTRRWLSFTAMVIVMLVLCGIASRWQWNRHVHRDAANAVITTNMAKPSAPLDDVMHPGEPVDPGEVWRTATATGQYDPAGEVIIRKRPYGGQNGYWIITPLNTPGGTILINRGWVPAPGDARADPPRPAPPSGTVTVTGRVRADEGDAGPRGDLPANHFMRVDVRGIAARAAGPVYPGYLELISSNPPGESLRLIEAPEPSSGPHVFYSIQWILFGLIGVVGWFRILRRESSDTRSAADGESAEVANA